MDRSDGLPSYTIDNTTSFYPYPIQSRTELHHTLKRGIRGIQAPHRTSPHTIGESHAGPSTFDMVAGGSKKKDTSTSTRSPISFNATHESIRADRQSLKRARDRAVSGRRSAGVGLGREAEELSEEEEIMFQERVSFDPMLHSFSSQLIEGPHEHVWTSFLAAYRTKADSNGDG